MDQVLLNKVKKLTKKLKKEYDDFYGTSTIEELKTEVSLVFQIISYILDILNKVDINIIIDNNSEYEVCRKGLKLLVKNLVKLSAHFMREQDYNIRITNDRMKNGDTEAYLKDRRFNEHNLTKDDENNKSDKFIIEENEKLKELHKKLDKKIVNIVKNTEKRYTQCFGEFKNYEEANVIIKKEYLDSTSDIHNLLDLKEKIYEKRDNFETLITFTQSISKELIQLNAVLDRAERMKKRQQELAQKKTSDALYVFFIIMDGVNSTKEKSIEKLKENTTVLNMKLAESTSIKKCCNVKILNQDEGQAIVVAKKENFEEFLNIVDNVYETKVRVSWALAPFKQIDEYIENAPYMVFGFAPYLHGPICIEARKNLELRKKFVVLGKNSRRFNGIIIDESEISSMPLLDV